VSAAAKLQQRMRAPPSSASSSSSAPSLDDVDALVGQEKWRSLPSPFARPSNRTPARTLVAVIDSSLMAYAGGYEHFSYAEQNEIIDHVWYQFVQRGGDGGYVLADNLTCVMRSQRVAVREFILTEVGTLKNLYDIIHEIFYNNVCI